MTGRKDRTGDRFFLRTEYALGYIALSICSAEEWLLGRALRKVLRNHLPNAKTLLDIGCADGRLTLAIAKEFEIVSFYEPNPTLFSFAVSRLSRSVRLETAANQTFPPRNLSHQQFDAVLCSHVLYHIEPDRWDHFFRCVAKVTVPGGVLIAVLWNANSIARQMSLRANPNRWLTSAADLMAMEPALRRAGFQILDRVEEAPVVRAHTRDCANLVSNFLLGEYAATGKNVAEVAQELGEMLCGTGLRNSQDIFVLGRIKS